MKFITAGRCLAQAPAGEYEDLAGYGMTSLSPVLVAAGCLTGLRLTKYPGPLQEVIVVLVVSLLVLLRPVLDAAVLLPPVTVRGLEPNQLVGLGVSGPGSDKSDELSEGLRSNLNERGGLLSMVEALFPGGGGLKSLISSVSKVDLASFSATMFLTTLWPLNFTLQVGQLRTSGFPLHSSHITCPLLHWKIFLGGFISSRQTGHSSRSRTRV